MNKMNAALGVLAALCIVACGGGGGSTPAVAASKMAPYIGTWVGPCDGHELPSLTISDTAGVKDGATYSATSAHYAQAGCTGTIVATQTYTANFSAVYVNSINAGVIFPGAAAVSTKIDSVSLSVQAYRNVLTGSGVTHPINNGAPEWCIAYGDGSSSCFQDELVPGYATYITNTYVSGNKLHVLVSGVAGYTVTEVWTKR